MESTGALRPSVLDPTMRFLSRAADHGVLWMVVAALLAMIGGRPRRAAARGLLALAGSSALANGILKPLFPRRRPPARVWLSPKRGVDIPTSSSFPSGHSSSAAAFTAAVAMESPVAGAALAPLAAAVAYSRVHNGVHWPSDVFAGLAVGGAIAAGTRRWWAGAGRRTRRTRTRVRGSRAPARRRLVGLHQSWFRLRGRRDRGIDSRTTTGSDRLRVRRGHRLRHADRCQDPRALAESVGCMRRRRNSGHGRDRGDKARATTCGFSRRNIEPFRPRRRGR